MEQQTPATIVVVESGFGNTRRIAEAIAAGVGSGTPVIDIDDAPASVRTDVGLLIVGGPTHAFGMSRSQTRATVGEQGGSTTGQGIREWIDALEGSTGCRIATFDTKVARMRRFPGSAASGAAKSLRRKGFVSAARPESFYVTDSKGPLLEGEIERARSWGNRLAAVSGETTQKG